MPDQNTSTIELAESLDLTAASPLAQALKDIRGTAVSISAGKVIRLGGQCLQVLLSAHNTWKADGVSFQIEEPSTEFIEGLEDFGLSLHSFSQEEM